MSMRSICGVARGWWIVVGVVATLGVMWPHAAHAAGGVLGRWVLRERLEKKWVQELVSFAFPGHRRARCRGGQLPILVGPRGTRIAHQIDGGRIHFVVPVLYPLKTNVYVLRCMSRRLRPPTDFSVTVTRGRVTLMTSKFLAVIPLGAAQSARGLAGVPGPIQRMTIRRRGRALRSFGRSEMFGRDRIVSYRAQLEARGPVFARVAFVYHYRNATGRDRYDYKLHLTAQLATGDGQLRWTSRIESRGRLGKRRRLSGWRLLIAKRELPRLVFVHRPSFDNVARMSRSSSGYNRAILRRQSPKAFSVGQHRYRHFYMDVWRWRRGQLVGRLSPWNFIWIRRSFTRMDFLIGVGRQWRPFFQVTSSDSGRWHPRKRPEDLPALPTPRPILRRCPILQRGQAPGVLTMLFTNTGQSRAWRWGNPVGALGTELDWAKSLTLDWSEATPRAPLMLDVSLWSKYRRRHRSSRPAFRRRVAKAGAWVSRWIKDILRRRQRPYVSVTSVRRGNASFGNAFREVIDVNLIAPSANTVKNSRLKEFLSVLLALGRDDQQHTVSPDKFDFADHFFFRYHAFVVIHLYSLLRSINVWKSQQERRLFRAKMAYFAHKMFRPEVWSTARGYTASNLNMALDVVFSRGVFGALFPRHPKSRQWLAYGRSWETFFLRRIVAPDGSTDQNDHYSQTLFNAFLFFRLSAPKRGRGIQHPRFKRLLDYHLQLYTPADPRFGGKRRVTSYNRSEAGGVMGLPGLLAPAFWRLGDREQARRLQYFWKAEGGEARHSKLGASTTMLLFGKAMVDESLDAANKPWFGRFSSTQNRNFTLFRHGHKSRRGGRGEHSMFFLNTPLLSAGLLSSGSVKSLFAYGQPISSAFGHGVGNSTARRVSMLRESPLQSRVLVSRPWMQRKLYARRYGGRVLWYDHMTTSAKGRQLQSTRRIDSLLFRARLGFAWTRSLGPSYLVRQGVLPGAQRGPFRGKYRPFAPIWPTAAYHRRPKSDPRKLAAVSLQRQIAFVKSPDASNGVHYYVFRDDVRSLLRKPVRTEWTSWTLTDGIYSTRARRKSRMGRRVELRPRRLVGQRFTALGRTFRGQTSDRAVDVEYFVVHPRSTPRHTLHWGTFFVRNHDPGFADYQDLLHLQRPDNGPYFVVMFPRRNVARRPAAPRFRALGVKGKEKVVHIYGRRLAGGTFHDFVFVSRRGESHRVDNVPFPGRRGRLSIRGRVAAVQFRGGRLAVLSLSAIGRKLTSGAIVLPGYRLVSSAPCSVEWVSGRRSLRIEISRQYTGTARILLRVPRRLRGVSGRRVSGGYEYKLSIRGQRTIPFR